MDLQKMMDATSATCKRERANYHLTLGKLITALKALPAQTPVVFDNGNSPDDFYSYRGYYEDLAIGEKTEEVTAGQFLDKLESNALNKEFEGYKGGEFLMGIDTPLWVSEYGSASQLAIVGASYVDGIFTLITKQVE
jgi:hypothetical protein